MLLTLVAATSASCGLFRDSKPGPGQPGWVDPESVEGGKAGKLSSACITPPDEAAAITHGAADGLTRVRYCVGEESAQCFTLDLGSGKLARLAAPPPDAAKPDGAHVETQNPELKVCSADACKTLTPKVIPQASQLHAATNAAGTHFVVLLGNAPAGQGIAEIWDVAKAKKTASFRYARGEFRCGDVALLGNTIYVGAAHCGKPAARGTLFSLKGARIANVGNKDFGVYGDQHVQIAPTKWAFLEENGHRIAVQDVVKGKVEKTITLEGLFGDDQDAIGNPGESALVRLADGRLAVIAGSPANGSVAVVDVATSMVAITRAPLCGR